ncbi:MAG: hypothetical protein EZS28_049689, partial [Streblomastix strix]
NTKQLIDLLDRLKKYANERLSKNLPIDEPKDKSLTEMNQEENRKMCNSELILIKDKETHLMQMNFGGIQSQTQSQGLIDEKLRLEMEKWKKEQKGIEFRSQNSIIPNQFQQQPVFHSSSQPQMPPPVILQSSSYPNASQYDGIQIRGQQQDQIHIQSAAQLLTQGQQSPFDHNFEPNQSKRDEIKMIILPQPLFNSFVNAAQSNNIRDIETCGILCGRIMNRKSDQVIVITNCVLPPQHATKDTCQAEGEEIISTYVIEN